MNRYLDSDATLETVFAETLHSEFNWLESVKFKLIFDTKKRISKGRVTLASVELANEKVKFFTTDNIQGSETDFFIFDTAVITSDTISHKLKAFYTYMSRAKTSSIIIDSGNISEFGIISKEDEVTEIITDMSFHHKDICNRLARKAVGQKLVFSWDNL